MGRRSLIVLVLVVGALGGWTAYRQSQPAAPKPADLCAVWKPGLAALRGRYPVPTTVSRPVDPDFEGIYIGPSRGDDGRGPLAFLPGDAAARPAVMRLLRSLVAVAPHEVKAQVEHYIALEERMADLRAGRASGQPVDVTDIGKLIMASDSYDRVDGYLLTHCGMPPAG